METVPYRIVIAEYIRRAAQPREKFSHQPRLYALATSLAEGRSYDDDIVFAGAWLHDLGVFVGHRPENLAELAAWDHIAYAAKVVPAVLSKAGFPPEKIPAVVEVIRTHMPSGDPTTFEGTLLRDADILEQLGGVGILRTVCKVGRDTRFPTFAEAVAALERNAATLVGCLRLPAAIKAAEPRLAILSAFLAAVAVERNGVEL
jgi:uncharacterized protein